MDLKDKKTKKAEFIDLKDDEFKKKNNKIKTIIIIAFLVSLIFLFYNFDLSFFSKNNKNAKPINTYEETQNLDLLEEQVVDIEKINEKDISESLNESDKNSQMLLIKKQYETNLMKLNELERLYLDLKNEINNVSNLKENNGNDLVNLLANQNLKLFTFIQFKRKVINNMDFIEEFSLLKNLYKTNVEVSDLLSFFDSLARNNYKSYDDLIILLDDELSLGKKKILDDKNLDKGNNSFNVRDYLRQMFNSTFKVKKITEEQTLVDYEDNNFDGIIDFKNKLIQAKEFLIAGKVNISLEKISELNSPYSDTLKKWIDYAELRSEVESKLSKLEERVFSLFLENYDD